MNLYWFFVIPGQFFLLHSWYFISSPVQFWPPFEASWSFDLSFFWIPESPQLSLHGDQISLQFPHRQLTKNEYIYVAIIEKYIKTDLIYRFSLPWFSYRKFTYHYPFHQCNYSYYIVAQFQNFLHNLFHYVLLRSFCFLLFFAALLHSFPSIQSNFLANCPIRNQLFTEK